MRPRSVEAGLERPQLDDRGRRDEHHQGEILTGSRSKRAPFRFSSEAHGQRSGAERPERCASAAKRPPRPRGRARASASHYAGMRPPLRRGATLPQACPMHASAPVEQFFASEAAGEFPPETAPPIYEKISRRPRAEPRTRYPRRRAPLLTDNKTIAAFSSTETPRRHSPPKHPADPASDKWKLSDTDSTRGRRATQ